MSSRHLQRLGLVALSAWGLSPAPATADSVWVEPLFQTCEGRVLHPDAWHQGDGDGDRLDADSNVGEASETGDTMDLIEGSIADALGTADQFDIGLVYIPRRGEYLETQTSSIDEDMFVHGFAHADIIVTPDCEEPPDPLTAFEIDLGSGEDAVIENITIRGFTIGIDLASTSGGSLTLRNVTFEDCTTAIDLDTLSGGDVILENVRIRDSSTAIDLTGTTGGRLFLRNSTLDGNGLGIEDDGGDMVVQVVGSRIRGGTRGIETVLTLTVVDSEISNNSVYGVVSTFATSWRFSGSTISHNGSEGIAVQGSGTGTQTVELTRCRISENGDTGVSVDGALVHLTMRDTDVTGNGDDGVHLLGEEGSTFSITHCSLSANAGEGLLVQNTMSCTGLTNRFEGSVVESQVVGNGDDGIEIGGTASCSPPTNWPGPVACGLLRNTIASNTGHGLDAAASGSQFDCALGENLIAYNVAGNFNGTASCGTAGSSSNQVN